MNSKAARRKQQLAHRLANTLIAAVDLAHAGGLKKPQVENILRALLKAVKADWQDWE